MGGRWRVMVIEQDEDLRAVLGDSLTLAGHRVHVARSVDDAFIIVQAHPGSSWMLLLDLHRTTIALEAFLRRATLETAPEQKVRTIAFGAPVPDPLAQDTRIASVLRDPLNIDELLAAVAAAVK